MAKQYGYYVTGMWGSAPNGGNVPAALNEIVDEFLQRKKVKDDVEDVTFGL